MLSKIKMKLFILKKELEINKKQKLIKETFQSHNFDKLGSISLVQYYSLKGDGKSFFVNSKPSLQKLQESLNKSSKVLKRLKRRYLISF